MTVRLRRFVVAILLIVGVAALYTFVLTRGQWP